MGIQSGSIWLALLTGLFLAMLYDLLRILQIAFSGSLRHRFLPDFFFLLFCGLVTELLAIAAEFGRVRFYLIACEIISVCAYQMTLGIVTRRFALALCRLNERWRRLRRRLTAFLLRGIRRLVKMPVCAPQKRNGKKPQKMGKIP